MLNNFFSFNTVISPQKHKTFFSWEKKMVLTTNFFVSLHAWKEELEKIRLVIPKILIPLRLDSIQGIRV